MEKKYEEPIGQRFLRLEVLDRMETLQEEIEDMKNIIKEDMLSKERSDEDVNKVNERIKELERIKLENAEMKEKLETKNKYIV